MKRDLSCVGCHGGDATSDDEEVAHAGNFVGIPAPKDIPDFCGKCHSDLRIMRRFQPSASTDQVSQYYTSVHGEKLQGGDLMVAQCASCHTSHAILPASDGRSSVHPLNVPEPCATSAMEMRTTWPGTEFARISIGIMRRACMVSRCWNDKTQGHRRVTTATAITERCRPESTRSNTSAASAT